MAKKQSATTKHKISLAQEGRRNSFYGRSHKAATRQELSAKNRGKNNPMFGRRHSAQAREKMRQAALRRARKAH